MLPSSLRPSGRLTCLASKAECGQGQQGEEHVAPHGVSLRWLWVCCSKSAVSTSLQHHLYSGPCPGDQGGPPDHSAGGSRGLCQGYLGSSAPDL